MSCSKSGDIFLNLSSVKWVWSQDNASLKMAGKHSFYFGHQCCVDSVWFASIAPVKKSKLKRAVFLTEIQDHATHWQVILCCAALLWSCTYGSASDPDYITVWKPVFWASLLWSSGKWINSFQHSTYVWDPFMRHGQQGRETWLPSLGECSGKALPADGSGAALAWANTHI